MLGAGWRGARTRRQGSRRRREDGRAPGYGVLGRKENTGMRAVGPLMEH
uniref:Uncharacterized protein n=1 Tax=Arundo donax TaxID=35708 RepID=A0A0A9BSI1_ARUDO